MLLCVVYHQFNNCYFYLLYEFRVNCLTPCPAAFKRVKSKIARLLHAHTHTHTTHVDLTSTIMK